MILQLLIFHQTHGSKLVFKQCSSLDSRLSGKSCTFTYTGTERTEDYMNQKAGKGQQYQREGLQRLGIAQEAPVCLV